MQISYLDDRIIDTRDHFRGILVSVLSRCVTHDTPVEFRCLRIFTLLTFMRVVGLPRNNVIGNRVRRLRSVRSERMLEAVGRVLLVASMVGIGPHWSVKVETGVITGHEGAIDRHLMEIDPDAMVLGITVKEHTELKKWIWAVLDTRHHATRAEGSLLHVPMIVLRVLV